MAKHNGKEAYQALMRTSLPGLVAMVRVWIGVVCLLAGVRAMALISKYAGASILARPPFEITGGELRWTGLVGVVAGGLLVVGWLTRVVAILPMVMSVLVVIEAWSQVGTMGTAEALNQCVRSLGIAGASWLMVVHGAGRWSVDAALTRKGS